MDRVIDAETMIGIDVEDVIQKGVTAAVSVVIEVAGREHPVGIVNLEHQEYLEVWGSEEISNG